jgi:hypothetical protein
MANKTLFSSIKSKFTRTDTVNEAGGRAYKFTPKHALAQMAATGCFNGVFYASAQSQLDEMRAAVDQVDDNTENAMYFEAAAGESTAASAAPPTAARPSSRTTTRTAWASEW